MTSPIQTATRLVLLATLVSACVDNVAAPELGFVPRTDAAFTGVWTPRTSMPRPSTGTAVATANGRIFLFGGEVQNDCAFTHNVQIYDPATDAWSSNASLPTRRAYGAAVAVGNTIHVLGGVVGCGPSTGVNEVYDITTGAWHPETPMAQRYGQSVVSHAGKIYVLGGFVAGQGLNRVDEYDPSTQAWTARSPMPTGRGHMAAALLDGRVYTLSGCCGPAGTEDPVNRAVEVYDIATDTWTTRSARDFLTHSAGAAAVGPYIYLVGANDDRRGVKRYDPASDTWRDEAPLPIGVVNHSVAAAGGTVYVIGGWTDRITGAVWAYTPAPKNQTPTAIATAVTPLECVNGSALVSVDGGASFDPDGRIVAYDWSRVGATFATMAAAQLTLPLGVHTLTLTVNDDAGASDDDPVTVEVADTRAPEVQVSSTGNSLWPPNHRLVHVATVSASDACHGATPVSVSVTSSELADENGDGNSVKDWDLVPVAGGIAVYVRAERSGKGNGRLYTVEARATDGSGHETRTRSEYRVQSSEGGR